MKASGLQAVPWIVEPYIPREGIVFLYGKKGVGKSPLTWSLANAVATGVPWCSFPVTLRDNPWQVLYIEVDSPLSVVKARTDFLDFPGNLIFYFPSDPILASFEGYTKMVEETKHLSPDLVIVNTLRKIHSMDDGKGETVARVYALFRRLWPCVLFVSHEKKTPANPEHSFERGEEFSGHLAWHNDAQVCLNLHRSAGKPNGDGSHPLILSCTGNQLHEQPQDLKLRLAPDGYSLSLR